MPRSRSHPTSSPRIRAVLGASLGVGLALLAVSCGQQRMGAGMHMPPVPVEVASTQAVTMRDGFTALGTVEADEVVQVVSELNVVVRRLSFVEGQSVARGAPLVLLDDREIRAEANRAAALHLQAKTNHARAQKLFGQQAVSQRELDDATASLQVAEANDALARARLAKTTIRAPFAGVIGRRRVSPGAYVKSGDEITELARLDVVKIAFSAPERYLPELRRGMSVQLTTPAYRGTTFGGKVTVVDPLLDANTRTVQLVARIPNPARALKPGMSANVAVTLVERPNALVVPDEAVFAEGNQSFVFRVNPDSTVAKTPVTLGSRDSMRVEIVHGLQAGDRIVSAGHQKLFDGAHVVPIPQETQTGGPEAAPAGGSAAGGTTAKGSSAQSKNGSAQGKRSSAPEGGKGSP